MIHTTGVQIREQSWSSHSRSFHLKLSAAFLFFSPPPPSSSGSFAFLSSHSHSFSPTLPHILYYSPLLSLPLTPVPYFPFSFMLSSSLLLFLLGREEVPGLFLDPLGIERWSSLSCNPFFIRHQTIATHRFLVRRIN